MALALAEPRPVPAENVTPPAELAAYLTSAVAYAPPADLAMDTWLEHGRMLARRSTRLQWLTADWARWGLDYYGPGAWSYIVSIAGLEKITLMKMIAVAQCFPPERRRSAIPFSRHIAVYRLPIEVADQLLLRAEREGWVQEDLIRQVRAYRGQPMSPKPKRGARRRAPVRTTTTTTTIVMPAVSDHRETAPVRCSGCLLVVGYAVGTRAVQSLGPAAVQRIGSGQLVMSAECTHCQSTTVIALGALEIPTAGLASQPQPTPSLAAGAG